MSVYSLLVTLKYNLKLRTERFIFTALIQKIFWFRWLSLTSTMRETVHSRLHYELPLSANYEVICTAKGLLVQVTFRFYCTIFFKYKGSLLIIPVRNIPERNIFFHRVNLVFKYRKRRNLFGKCYDKKRARSFDKF